MTGKWQHTFKRVRVPLLNDIHYGGHAGSRNRKRGWVLYWHELIPDELGQGGWRDWLRSLCVPSSRQTFINSSFSVWHNKGYVEGYIIIFFLCFCPIICADLRGTAPAPLVPAPPTFGHTQGSFSIAAPPPQVHRRRRQIVGGLPSEGNTALRTPSIAFRHLPPNSARFSYATEGALFVSAQLSSDAVSSLRNVRVLIWLEATSVAPRHARKHEAHPPRVKRVPSRFWFYLSWRKQHGQL